ncbi:MAG: M20/M25/M40 family metallo-hydrolase, partial [Deltaproteobacteria bacterium]|nr:M20/M25/M40 family metallo-hydrolase [Deltaproteobacteria bacterium]
MTPTEQLLGDLLRIDSTQGREGALGSYLCDLLEPHGYQVRRQPVAPSSRAAEPSDPFNLILTRGAPRLFLFGHLDTVQAVGGGGAEWSRPPFGATVEDGRMYGLGAVDMKGGIAAFVSAAL